jgi:hypothetical protein
MSESIEQVIAEIEASGIQEPESVRDSRVIVGNLIDLLDRGEIESISVYIGMRDGTYRNMQSAGPSRHEDAGRILELAMMRLNFAQKWDLEPSDD